MASIRCLNDGLQLIARQRSGVYVLDYDALVARHGRLHWHDELKWQTMRMPIAAKCLIHLADEYMRFIQPLAGKTCKVLVVDLDNTLWGGVAGEDGYQGIRLGPEYPASAYLALQRAIMNLYRRGLLLAICSKNNPGDVMPLLERHPHMLLRPNHFAAMRVNWEDKSHNLAALAKELNVGLDALALVDDSPMERALVRQTLPEVHVVELPPDPFLYAQALRSDPVFERLSLSQEDRGRSKLLRRPAAARSSAAVRRFPQGFLPQPADAR